MTAMTTAEAAQRLIGAMLVQFADYDDDEEMPMRLLFGELAVMCGVTDADVSDVPEVETMGWLRERAREALAELARGGLR